MSGWLTYFLLTAFRHFLHDACFPSYELGLLWKSEICFVSWHVEHSLCSEYSLLFMGGCIPLDFIKIDNFFLCESDSGLRFTARIPDFIALDMLEPPIAYLALICSIVEPASESF